MSELVRGDDGRARCAWGASSPEFRAYHDDEWGRPSADQQYLYEMLCLEGFQAGLSWSTILRKRQSFRTAFSGFDPEVVARFGDADVKRLLTDTGIVRNRGKISATITNARATLALRDRGTSLAAVMWRHQPASRRVPALLRDLPASTAESSTLSAELRRLGFAFVGPTTVYSAMQAIGIVDDHVRGCYVRNLVEAERKRFTVPS